MVLAYDTLEIRTLCERAAEAQQKFGLQLARALHDRLADLYAATSIYDLLVGRPRPLCAGDTRRIVIHLVDGYRLRLSANHTRNPLTTTGEIDWARVTRVKVERIYEPDGGDF